MLHRRAVLAGLAAAAVLPRRAMTTSLGTARLTTLSDGHLTLPGGFLFDALPEDDLAPLIARFDLNRDQLTPECNLALYQDGTNTVLFDVGSGPDFMPSAGQLTDSLDTAGIALDEVTHVVFTHAHPDHIWGLIDDFDEPLFPEATYMMGRREWDYWWNPETVTTIGEARAAFAVGAKRRMEFIEDAVEFFDDGAEILPGIAALASHGHTPGHMSFEIANGADRALVVGDAIGNHHIAFARPAWPSGADQDPDLGITTRQRLLDKLAHDQSLIVGFHLPGGGMGRVERSTDGYVFLPET
ncbi:MAG: MBL fold metallo-hydrolase [Silicimonas sp.]|nr:MBL fold metallo-hydrolase [Silicimonas sp.]